MLSLQLGRSYIVTTDKALPLYMKAQYCVVLCFSKNYALFVRDIVGIILMFVCYFNYKKGCYTFVTAHKKGQKKMRGSH